MRAAWVFYLSLVYGAGLGEAEFSVLQQCSRRNLVHQPREQLSAVDFVYYDEDGEHIEQLLMSH